MFGHIKRSLHWRRNTIYDSLNVLVKSPANTVPHNLLMMVSPLLSASPVLYRQAPQEVESKQQANKRFSQEKTTSKHTNQRLWNHQIDVVFLLF